MKLWIWGHDLRHLTDRWSCLKNLFDENTIHNNRMKLLMKWQDLNSWMDLPSWRVPTWVNRGQIETAAYPKWVCSWCDRRTKHACLGPFETPAGGDNDDEMQMHEWTGRATCRWPPIKFYPFELKWGKRHMRASNGGRRLVVQLGSLVVSSHAGCIALHARWSNYRNCKHFFYHSYFEWF